MHGDSHTRLERHFGLRSQLIEKRNLDRAPPAMFLPLWHFFGAPPNQIAFRE
jgi:hypothetical protein